jgi:hypothetical protein
MRFDCRKKIIAGELGRADAFTRAPQNQFMLGARWTFHTFTPNFAALRNWDFGNLAC